MSNSNAGEEVGKLPHFQGEEKPRQPAEDKQQDLGTHGAGGDTLGPLLGVGPSHSSQHILEHPQTRVLTAGSIQTEKGGLSSGGRGQSGMGQEV